MFNSRRRQLDQATQELATVCSRPMPGRPSRIIAVVGVKGGAVKSSTAAALLHTYAHLVPGMVVGVDFNDDFGTLCQSLGVLRSTAQGRLVSLAASTDRIGSAAELAPFMDLSGRVHLLHNEDVSSEQIQSMTQDQGMAVLDLLSSMASVIVVDCGTNLISPATRAVLARADQLVIASSAAPASINVTVRGVGQILKNGHAELVADATAVLTKVTTAITDKQLAKGRAFFEQKCADVVVVPYDHAIAASSAIPFNTLSPATRLAHAQVAASASRALIQWPRHLSPSVVDQQPWVSGWNNTDTHTELPQRNGHPS